jgi:hypothetical protein
MYRGVVNARKDAEQQLKTLDRALQLRVERKMKEGEED